MQRTFYHIIRMDKITRAKLYLSNNGYWIAPNSSKKRMACGEEYADKIVAQKEAIPALAEKFWFLKAIK